MRWINPVATYKALDQRGILGMNCRNIGYISRYNPRRLYPLVDNKLKTKQLALKHHVNVPGLITTVTGQFDIRGFAERVKGYNGFCIKPAQGSGGKGILVVLPSGSDSTPWQRTNGKPLILRDLERHFSNILAGVFSLGGRTDVALVEELIQVDPIFDKFTYEGVPDLRVIVFKGFPVMAMMRLSCHASNGKANLHQGAVGVGIDIVSGQAINAVQYGQAVTHHPDTQQRLLDLQIPHWDTLLNLACTCYDMTGLGYIGVDIVIDRNHGPLLLELNARPGLAIQVANNTGLLPRLRYVESLAEIPDSVEDRISLISDYLRQQDNH